MSVSQWWTAFWKLDRKIRLQDGRLTMNDPYAARALLRFSPKATNEEALEWLRSVEGQSYAVLQREFGGTASGLARIES